MLENIRVWIVILGLKSHIVPLIKFITDLVIYISLEAANDLEWSEANNTIKNGNARTNVIYLQELYIIMEDCRSEQRMTNIK
jgi:hypothetical protein